MRKSVGIILSIVVVVAVIASCIFVYRYFTKEEEEEVITKEALYMLDNYPKVDASLATQPLAIAFMSNFIQKELGKEEIANIQFTNTHPAYERLVRDEVDLILVTSPSEDELQYAKDHGVELEVIPVVKEGFVFYVNTKNPVESLTVDQIQSIYAGEITNWKEVGGEDKPIVAYQRPRNSGSQTGMIHFVMKDKKLMEAPKETMVETMSEIVNLVSSYENEASSIGYSYYYYATTMYQTIDPKVANGIKFLGMNGVKPNIDTIRSGEYPFTTAYYIVINKADDENSAARKLANQMLSSRGQKVAQEAGYVPVK